LILYFRILIHFFQILVLVFFHYSFSI
jgi:hypothetical protein